MNPNAITPWAPSAKLRAQIDRLTFDLKLTQPARDYLASCMTGGLTGFALRSGAPKSIISRWLNEPSARVSLAQLLDIAANEGLSLSALLQGSLLKLTEPCPVTEPHRVRRFLQPCDHEMIKVALTQAVAAGKTLTDVAKDLHVDLSTLAQHADLYASLRDAARLTAAEARAQRHAKAVQRAESAVLALLSTGKTPSMRNARAVTGEPWNPSELASVALTLLRIGLGENRLAYPFPASKVSEEFIARVDEAAQRIKVQMGITQAKLPLQYA
jgi:hypothetical protein